MDVEDVASAAVRCVPRSRQHRLQYIRARHVGSHEGGGTGGQGEGHAHGLQLAGHALHAPLGVAGAGGGFLGDLCLGKSLRVSVYKCT